MKLIAIACVIAFLRVSAFQSSLINNVATFSSMKHDGEAFSRQIQLDSEKGYGALVVDLSKEQAVSINRSQKLHVQIEDKIYNLTGWRQKHPAGSHWIDRFHLRDATEVMYAFHSDKALQMFKKFPIVKNASPTIPDNKTRSFRELRAKLVRDGWFKRNWKREAFLLSSQILSLTVGVVFAKMGNIPASIAVLGISHTTGGWLAHDYIHGRGKWCSFMRFFGAITMGLGVKWWSEKHNLHHAFTNQVEPILFLWSPSHKREKPWRKFQHLYWPVPFSSLFFMWRVDSIKTAISERKWHEIAAIALHYVLLFNLLNPLVSIGSILLGGFLTATIVTVTHTAEDLLIEDPGFVEAQFRTTRDARCSDPISEYIWGGMQYQLEHHLFPTMPRYNYSKLVPVIKEWARRNDLLYRESGSWEIIARNINQLKTNGSAEIDPDSPCPAFGSEI